MSDIERLKALEQRIAHLEQLDPEPIACRVYNSGDFTHDSSGNYLAITFDSERRDILGMHSTTSNQSRITFTIGGWYLVGGGAIFATNDTGLRQLTIRLGGSTYLAVQTELTPTAALGSMLSISTLYYFAATNYIELVAYQNSGGNLAITAAGNYSPEFWAIRMA